MNKYFTKIEENLGGDVLVIDEYQTQEFSYKSL